MADTDIAITAGSGTKVDTRTVGAGTDEHRQVIVVGDPATAANVQAVSAAGAASVDTELPAAAALSDTIGNPTSPMVGAGGMVFDGTNWVRIRMASTGASAQTVGVQATSQHNWDSSYFPQVTAGNSNAGDGSAGGYYSTHGMMVYNGASFDRARGDVTNGQDVDVTRIQGSDIDHDVANTLKNIQVAGHASPVDLPPTAVSANADRVRAWYDRFGSQVVRRRKIRESYTAVFRLAETTARLDQTFTLTGNTNKQYATLHHAASATKELQLQMCRVWVTLAGTAVFQGIIELRELSSATAPATGNPAITGRPHRIGTGAHEATALYLPTTQGSEAAANSPLGSLTFDLGIESATVSTTNPLPGGVDGPAAYTLFDASRMDDQVMAPTAPVGVYGGWAIVFRSTAATVLRATAQMVFTEEIP